MPLSTPSPNPLEHEHRRRLLQAMAAVTAEKGFAAATIADVVRVAGVSKRSFYEQFDTKAACFLELYRAVSASALRTLSAAVDPARPWQHQLEQAFDAFLTHLAASPVLLKTLFVEIHHLGEAGTVARREVMQHMAQFMLSTVGAPAHGSLNPALAMAAVGAINELILERIEQGRAADLPDLTASASEVIRRLTQTERP